MRPGTVLRKRLNFFRWRCVTFRRQDPIPTGAGPSSRVPTLRTWVMVHFLFHGSGPPGDPFFGAKMKITKHSTHHTHRTVANKHHQNGNKHSRQTKSIIMGIGGFTQCLYKSVELEWEHFWHILNELKKKRVRAPERDDVETPEPDDNNSNEYIHPVIDIDANNIAFKRLHDPGFLLNVTMNLIQKGVKVNMIADNRDYRHSSKRASYQRIANREISRLDIQDLNMELNAGLQAGHQNN